VALATVSAVAACGGEAATGDAGVDATPDCTVAAVPDPNFLTPTAWTPSGTTKIDVGAAIFDPAAICARGGIAQTFPSPARACAQPLVMTVDTALEDNDRLLLDVGVNGGWNVPAVRLGEQTTTLCLGARALGGAASVFLGISENQGLICPAANGEGPTLQIQRVSLDADAMNVCPPLGTVANGDFEGGAASWTLAPQLGTAEIGPGFGDGGSSGAHLATKQLCQTPRLTGSMSLPTSAMVPHPALQLWSRGTGNATATLVLGPSPPAYLPGAKPAGKTSLCLPRWAQGTVQPVVLGFLETTFAQDCTRANVRDFVFDALTFVSEPACPTDTDVPDPGFEQLVDAPALAPFWALEQHPDDQKGASVALVDDPTFAHSGRVAALLTVSSVCPDAELAATVAVPSSVGEAGPMLTFWYKTSALSHAGLSVTLSALTAAVPLPAASAWTQVRACLDGNLAGRPELLTFGITGGGGDCVVTYPAETLAVDDVALTTDPACPN
jgi:hypothetical protein